MGTPVVYDRSADRFVLLLERVALDDQAEQTLRHDLHAHLNSISLSSERDQVAFQSACDLWSLPFRYAELAIRLDQARPQEEV